MHEYGHHLQKQYLGKLYIMPSAFSLESVTRDWIFGTDNHGDTFAEMQASTMALYFFNFPSNFEAENPVDHSLITVQQQNDYLINIKIIIITIHEKEANILFNPLLVAAQLLLPQTSTRFDSQQPVK
jgi:hypothetical protein